MLFEEIMEKLNGLFGTKTIDKILVGIVDKGNQTTIWVQPGGASNEKYIRYKAEWVKESECDALIAAEENKK
jgi:hypothetical protein